MQAPLHGVSDRPDRGCQSLEMPQASEQLGRIAAPRRVDRLVRRHRETGYPHPQERLSYCLPQTIL